MTLAEADPQELFERLMAMKGAPGLGDSWLDERRVAALVDWGLDEASAQLALEMYVSSYAHEPDEVPREYLTSPFFRHCREIANASERRFQMAIVGFWVLAGVIAIVVAYLRL